MTIVTSDIHRRPSPGAVPPNRDSEIRAAQNQVIDRMLAAPDKARTTISTSGRVEDGLACSVRQGKFHARMDLGLAMGGDASAPSPGFFARAGIVGCVAIAVKMAAARSGLIIHSVDVSVETDFDDMAIFGLGTASAAPTETRITLRIDSDEDETVLGDLVTQTLECDPWFLALRDPQVVQTFVRVTSPG